MEHENTSIVPHAEQALRERLFCAGCIWHGACAFHESIPDADPLRRRAERRAARAPRRRCAHCRRPIRGLVEALRSSSSGELTHEACEVSPRGIDGRELSIATLSSPPRDVTILKEVARHRAGVVAVTWSRGQEDADRIDAAAFMRRRMPRARRQPRLPNVTIATEFVCPHWPGQEALPWGLEPLCKLEPCASYVRRLHVPDVAPRVRGGRR